MQKDLRRENRLSTIPWPGEMHTLNKCAFLCLIGLLLAGIASQAPGWGFYLGA